MSGQWLNEDTGGVGNTTGNAAIPGGTLAESRGWYSRGYLPHMDKPNVYQSVTFRLCDSVPDEVVEQWKDELQWRDDLPIDAEAMIALRRRIMIYEDAGHGACWLRDERIATLVQNALLHFDGERYRLIAWCIMPNHVHVLVETLPEYPFDKILHSWKSFTAQKANGLLARNGPFGARDYYDRYIRDDRHLAQTLAYIEQNPLKAGFVNAVEEWKFSSAYREK